MAFPDFFKPVVQDLLQSQGFKGELASTVKRLNGLLEYTVPDGKALRGQLVPLVYNQLVPNATKMENELANKIGWVVQIHQASVMVADDIMDKSETRRGKPCWYHVGQQGESAFNDTLILEHAAYSMIQKYLANQKEICTEMVSLFLDVSFKTCLGECIDLTAGNGKGDFDTYSMEMYKTLVKYKTAYYFIYLPIAAAMLLAGISKENNKLAWKIVEEVTLDIGYLFQVQDDYLDCFGDENVTGKRGTDIQNGKCTWLIVMAKQICGSDNFMEWEKIKSNYGQSDEMAVADVRKSYEVLCLGEKFCEYEQKASQNIKMKIKTLPVELCALGDILEQFVDKIYGRKK